MPLRRLPAKPVAVAVCLLVAALHLVSGPGYRGPFPDFVTGYLIDLALPFALVLLFGVGAARIPALASPWIRALAVFLLGSAIETLQSFGVPLFGRTFDPVDLLMYALGASAAALFERLALRPA